MNWKQKATNLTAVSFATDRLDVAVGRTEDGQFRVESESTAMNAAELRQRLNPPEHQVVTAIGAEETFCHTLQLPTTQPAELQQMLDLQMDQLTPLPLEEVVYDFEPLGTADGRTRVLVAIARKSAVNERVAALEAVGLPPQRVSVDVVALWRTLRSRQLLPADDKLNVFVRWAADRADVVLSVREQPVVLRTIWLGAADFAEELQRTILAAQVEEPQTEVGRLTFAVNAVADREPAEELARRWPGGAEVLVNGAAPSLATSLCLDAATTERRLNLLPAEWRMRRRTAHRRQIWLRVGIAIAAVYVGALLVLLALTGVRQAHLNRLQTETTALRPDYEQARRLQSELVAMQLQLDTKFSALDVLREVSVVMPENLKLSGYTFRRDDTVTLKGQADSAPAVYDFISKLEQSELFASVKTVGVRTEGAGGLTKFELLATLKSAAAGKTGGGTWR